GSGLQRWHRSGILRKGVSSVKTHDPHTPKKEHSLLDESFHLSITLKGLHALLETVLGIAILMINPQTLNRWVLAALNQELSNNPGDFVTTRLAHASQHFAA